MSANRQATQTKGATTLTTGTVGFLTTSEGDNLIRIALWEDVIFGRWLANVTVFNTATQTLLTDERQVVTPKELAHCRQVVIQNSDGKGLSVYDRPDYLAKIAEVYWTLIK